MNHEVHIVFPSGVAIRIEEAIGKIRAQVHCQPKRGHIVISSGCCLCATDRASDLAIADTELVLILSEWAKTFSLDFNRVVDITRSVRSATIHDMAQTFISGNDIAGADRVGARRYVFFGVMVIQRYRAADGNVTGIVVRGRTCACPYNDGVGVPISRCYAVGEAQACRVGVGKSRLALHDLWDRDAQAAMEERRRAIVDVGINTMPARQALGPGGRGPDASSQTFEVRAASTSGRACSLPKYTFQALYSPCVPSCLPWLAKDAIPRASTLLQDRLHAGCAVDCNEI